MRVLFFIFCIRIIAPSQDQEHCFLEMFYNVIYYFENYDTALQIMWRKCLCSLFYICFIYMCSERCPFHIASLWQRCTIIICVCCLFLQLLSFHCLYHLIFKPIPDITYCYILWRWVNLFCSSTFLDHSKYFVFLYKF